MRITSITIQNFRKLLECHIDISEQTTLFVGANNSGKTSAMDAFAKFLANHSFVFNDITIAQRGFADPDSSEGTEKVRKLALKFVPAIKELEGVGYQNLISMFFDLIGFRDGWMREGKAKDTNE